jgi:hypothetical protein
MIIPIFILSIILFFLYLISFYLIKKIEIYSNISIDINHSILLFAIYFIIFISFLWHLMLPLKYLFFFIIIASIIYSIKNLNFLNNLRKIKINLFYVIFIVIFIFVSLSNTPIYDTMLYHHQVLNWFSDFAISKNLIEIDIRLGMVSPWHMFLSLFNHKINNYNLSFVANLIPFVILTLISIQALEKKLSSLSDFFLINCYAFIIIFSLIHPFGNGILLMELGSIGTDLAASIFFILSVYFFMKFYESENQNQKDLFFLYLIITCTLTFFSRISYVSIYILLLPILLNSLNKKYILILSVFLALPILLFVIKNILTSNCLIFPIYQTCDLIGLDSYKELVRKYNENIISFQRSSPNHELFGNFESTNNTFLWFKPWFLNFFLKTSIFQISYFIIIILSLIIFIDKFTKKIINFNLNNFYIILFLFLISNIIWLIAPDARFSYGFLISFSMYLSSILCKNFSKLYKSQIKNVVFIGIFLLCLKNYSNYEYLFKLNKSDFYDYSKLIMIKKDKDLYIFKSNHDEKFCYDIKNVCIGKDKVNFKIYNEFLFNKAIKMSDD